MPSPARTRVAAPPRRARGQVVFETERAAGVAAAIDRSLLALAGRVNHQSLVRFWPAGIQLFRRFDLQDIPIDLSCSIPSCAGGNVKLEVSSTDGKQRLEHPVALLGWQVARVQVRAAGLGKEAPADSTAGFTSSGSFLLESDCAESSKTKVNGVEAFWIRGQLTETLPPDPTKILPEVDSVKISALVDQRLKARLSAVLVSNNPLASPGRNQLTGIVRNEAGERLGDLDVKITSPVDPNFPQRTIKTNNVADHVGEYDSTNALVARESYELEVAFLNLDASHIQRNVEPERNLEIDLTFNVDGLDLIRRSPTARTRRPSRSTFGQQPQPGSVFYFTQEEVFTCREQTFRST
jgi:hypothetical protein